MNARDQWVINKGANPEIAVNAPPRLLHLQSRTNSVDSRPDLADFGCCRAKSSRNRTKVGRFRANFGQARAKVGRIRAKFDRDRANVIHPEFGSNLVDFGPYLVEFGPNLAVIGRSRMIPGQIGRCLRMCKALVPESQLSNTSYALFASRPAKIAHVGSNPDRCSTSANLGAQARCANTLWLTARTTAGVVPCCAAAHPAG